MSDKSLEELGDGSTYRPDFYLPRFGWYVEVSGYVSDEKRWKVDQFRELYGELKHVTKPAYNRMCEGFTNELELE